MTMITANTKAEVIAALRKRGLIKPTAQIIVVGKAGNLSRDLAYAAARHAGSIPSLTEKGSDAYPSSARRSVAVWTPRIPDKLESSLVSGPRRGEVCSSPSPRLLSGPALIALTIAAAIPSLAVDGLPGAAMFIAALWMMLIGIFAEWL